MRVPSPLAATASPGRDGLALAHLAEQAAARREPLRCGGGHPAQQVQPVRAAVEGHARLVQPGFRRQQGDLAGRDVGDVGGQHVDPPAQRAGQRIVQVALVHLAGRGGHVAPGAPHRGRIDVGGVQLGVAQGRGHRGAHRPGPAAQVENDHRLPRPGRLPAEHDRDAGEIFGAPARDEDARVDGDPLAAELGPAEHLLERQPGDAPGHQVGEVGRGLRRRDEQLRLLLGEDAARGAQRADDRRQISGTELSGTRQCGQRSLPAWRAVRLPEAATRGPRRDGRRAARPR